MNRCLALLLLGVVLNAPCPCSGAPSAAWTWIGGSQDLNRLPNYGLQLNETMYPGGRDTGACISLPSGSMMLTCGFGPDINGTLGWLSDTWVLSRGLNWKWIAGSPLVNSTGNYTGSPQSPGSRSGTMFFPTNMPDVHALFAGFGYGRVKEANGQGKLNDLWLFNTTSLDWFYLAGPGSVNGSGTYNQMGIYNDTSWPGSRVGPAFFQHPLTNVTIFGGWGFATDPTYPGPLSDYWCLYLSVNCARKCCLSAKVEWTWIGGPDQVNQAANDSLPPGRYGSTHWTLPSTGDGYIFGGWGRYSSGDVGVLDDLWHYNRTANTWNQIASPYYPPPTTPSRSSFLSSTSSSLSFTGSASEPLSVITYSNWPSARYMGMGWIWPGTDNVLALFGGSIWNDLWLFYTDTQKWVRLGGGITKAQYGVYGTLGKSSASNWPGSRYGSYFWFTSNLSVVLFGGFGLSVASQGSACNDLSDIWQLDMTA